MTFGKSIQSCFSKYVTFKGRACRSEFWWWYLFTFLVGFVASIIDVKISTSAVSLIVNLVFLLPGLAVAVRRIHDSNHNGWWVICPIYNFILMFFSSTPGVNDYGELED